MYELDLKSKRLEECIVDRANAKAEYNRFVKSYNDRILEFENVLKVKDERINSLQTLNLNCEDITPSGRQKLVSEIVKFKDELQVKEATIKSLLDENLTLRMNANNPQTIDGNSDVAFRAQHSINNGNVVEEEVYLDIDELIDETNYFKASREQLAKHIEQLYNQLKIWDNFSISCKNLSHYKK